MFAMVVSFTQCLLSGVMVVGAILALLCEYISTCKGQKQRMCVQCSLNMKDRLPDVMLQQK